MRPMPAAALVAMVLGATRLDAASKMGGSADYKHVPEWRLKDTGYQKEAMVKYKGNVFVVAYEPAKKAPGVDPQEGWRLYDELYDVTTLTGARSERMKVIGYIPSWRKGAGFEYTNPEVYRNITHGIVAFLEFDEANLGEFKKRSLDNVNGIIDDVVRVGHVQGTKISIALGGASDLGFLKLLRRIGQGLAVQGGEARFTDPAAERLLDRVVQYVACFVHSHCLDGVDLDLERWWGDGNSVEEESAQNKSRGAKPAGYALTAFAAKLRSAVPGMTLSAATFGTSWFGNNYDPKVVDHLDWLALMTYDLTGSWNASPVGPHTALKTIRDQTAYLGEQQGPWPETTLVKDVQPYKNNPIHTAEDSIWYWTNPGYINWQGRGQSLPRAKIAVGVPAYGYDFAHGKDRDPETGQVGNGYKTLEYRVILAQYPDAHLAPNANIKVPGQTPRVPFVSAPGNYPYAHNIYFETPATAVTKLNYIRDIGGQGVIVWDLTQDVQDDARSIVKALYRASGNPTTRPLIPTLGTGDTQRATPTE